MKVLLVLAATLAVAFAGTVDEAVKTGVSSKSITHAIFELPPVIQEVSNNEAILSLSGDVKTATYVATLTGLTKAAQAPYVAKAEGLGLQVQQLWISNVFLVKGLTEESLATLAAMPGDFRIRLENTVRVTPSIKAAPAAVTQNPQWGVAMVRAPECWDTTQGENVTVGVIDTGCNIGHVALANNFAGGWSDPYYNTPAPTDQHGHGSHCTGTICGQANGIGVAPQAKWHHCRGLNHQGSGSEANLLACAQFMTTVQPKPALVSNSWGGGGNSPWYNQAIQAWTDNGIIPVFALGNSGPSCRSAISPGDQGNLISVGATTDTDAMASFSSRGPNAAGALKPEISAPGANIVSAGTGANNYVTMSGTSMATPHVAGVIALLKARNPELTWETALVAMSACPAEPTLSNADRNCGLPGPGDFPNMAFGAGRVDAYTALMGC